MDWKLPQPTHTRVKMVRCEQDGTNVPQASDTEAFEFDAWWTTCPAAWLRVTMGGTGCSSGLSSGSGARRSSRLERSATAAICNHQSMHASSLQVALSRASGERAECLARRWRSCGVRYLVLVNAELVCSALRLLGDLNQPLAIHELQTIAWGVRGHRNLCRKPRSASSAFGRYTCV